MDALLDPNIAYLVLVAATFFVLIALAVPGTGLPEVLAMFSLFMAGYAVYQLSFNWWALLLLLASINQTADWGTSLRTVILAPSPFCGLPSAIPNLVRFSHLFYFL